jgi:hypothetical protein
MSDPTKLRPPSKASSEETIAQSVEPSLQDNKLATGAMPSPTNSVHEKSAGDYGEKSAQDFGGEETNKEKDATENTSHDGSPQEDEFEYPKKWTLAVITLALCLSVFCMALVCPIW